MAKTAIAFGYLLVILLLPVYSLGETCIERVYTSQIGVREATGKNDGKEVEMYLRNVNLGKGYSWCAAFVRWCFDQCGIKTSITAWSPTAHNAKNIVMQYGSYAKEPMPGDVFTVWNVKLKRIAHTGFFNKKINQTIFETVEGNTNDGGSREGDGVYKRRRSINSTFSITRWVK